MAESTHEILILGAHHAGLSLSHYLLKNTIPNLSKLTPKVAYHITLVAPHKEWFWNIAAPRVLVKADLIPEDKVYFSIPDAFKSYDAKLFTFTQGKATAVNPETKTVTIVQGEETKEVAYSTLVIATGTSYNAPYWGINGSETETKTEFAAIQKALATAKTVLISGGGAVGVETAGEIGSHLPSVKVKLVSGGKSLLPKLKPSTSAAAEKRLKALRVTVVHGVKSTGSKKNEDGTTTVELDNGTSEIVDVFIDATGGKPNSSFLPSEWLNSNGYVETGLDLRAKSEGVYALGDIASPLNASLIGTDDSVRPVASSIALDIAKQYKVTGPFKAKSFSTMQNTQFVPTGPNGGVGQVMGWGVPSMMVKALKSKSFFVSMVPDRISGKALEKA
jgi:NADH dehydrogenase FAD-containing subunit